MQPTKFIRFAVCFAAAMSVSGCVIAVNHKDDDAKKDTQARVVRTMRIETHGKDGAPPAAIVGCPEGAAQIAKDETTADGKQVKMLICTRHAAHAPGGEPSALLPKLAEVRMLLASDPELQGDAKSRVLAVIDEQIARVAVKHAK